MRECAKPISAKVWRMASSDCLLELSNVETSYGLSRVLFGVSLTIGCGEMVSLLGRNGMGKTAPVRRIWWLLPHAGGPFLLDVEEIAGLPAYRIAKRGIGLVREGRQVSPTPPAWENLVATAANYRDASTPGTLKKVMALFPRL